MCNFGVANWQTKFDAFARQGWKWTSVRVQLAAFLVLRNECAHTGNSSSVPTPSTVDGNCDLIMALSETIVDVLEDHLKGL